MKALDRMLIEHEADLAVKQVLASDVKEFDGKLAAALLHHAGRVGEMRLGRKDAHWLLKCIDLDFLCRWPNIIWTPAGPVPFIVEGD